MSTKKAKQLIISDELSIGKEFSQILGMKYLVSDSNNPDAIIGKITDVSPIGNHHVKLTILLTDEKEKNVSLTIHVNKNVELFVSQTEQVVETYAPIDVDSASLFHSIKETVRACLAFN